jgi:hypothetical protein
VLREVFGGIGVISGALIGAAAGGGAVTTPSHADLGMPVSAGCDATIGRERKNCAMSRTVVAGHGAFRRVVVSTGEKRIAIMKLAHRVAELRDLDVNTIVRGDDWKVKRIEVAIEATVAQIWGSQSHRYAQLRRASRLDRTTYVTSVAPSFRSQGGSGASIEEIRQGVEEGRQDAMTLLQQAADSLEQELLDEEDTDDGALTSEPNTPLLPSEMIIGPKIYSYGANAEIQLGRQKSIAIDRGPNFADFHQKMRMLLSELRSANDLPPEVKDQVAGELRAGMELIKTPRPDESALQTYLLRPLLWLTREFINGAVRAAAGVALGALAAVATGLMRAENDAGAGAVVHAK